jgi:hypothetical protein
MTTALPNAQHVALFGFPLGYRCPLEAACRALYPEVADVLPDCCATGQRGPAVARPCAERRGLTWPETNES